MDHIAFCSPAPPTPCKISTAQWSPWGLTPSPTHSHGGYMEDEDPELGMDPAECLCVRDLGDHMEEKG